MRSDSFDAIKAVVLSHGNRGNRAGGTREAPEEVVVVSPDDRATTTSPPRDDAPSREVPAGAAENAREEPRGTQPRERRDRGAAGVRRSPRAHAASRGSTRGGAGEADASRRVRADAAARSATPASIETTRKTQLAAEEPMLSRRRRRRGPDEDEEDGDGDARETQLATRKTSGERSRPPASRLAASRTPPAASFASLGVVPPTRLPPTATDAAAVTLAVATGGKDTAGGKETQLTQLSTSGEREQLARFAAAGAHVGLRATGIPAVAAARLKALALARTAADASRNGAG